MFGVSNLASDALISEKQNKTVKPHKFFFYHASRVSRLCIKIEPRSVRAGPLLNTFAPVKPAVEDINDLDPLGSAALRPQAICSILNQYLFIKIVCRQHKSILLCLRRRCEICRTHIYIYIYLDVIFFYVKAENDCLICMKKRNQQQCFGLIGISISPLIFIKDAFVIILFSLPSTGLNYISYYPGIKAKLITQVIIILMSNDMLQEPY